MIPIIVLAAGESRRFGRNKLLAGYGSDTIVSKVVKTCHASQADEVVVVLGHDAEAIRSVIDESCKVVINENYHLGQSSSVKVGLNSCSKYSEAVLFHPADVALISPTDINVVLDSYQSSAGSIVIASYQGKPGHPILFDKSIFDELAEITEIGHGLKAILRKHESNLTKVEATKEVLIDIDTFADYEKHVAGKL
ncbi:MAG: nucleotidyltransferase family protein [Nitrososphaerales archaeon]